MAQCSTLANAPNGHEMLTKNALTHKPSIASSAALAKQYTLRGH